MQTIETTIVRVGVVGCGAMGAGLAETFSLAGLDVRVAVSRPGAAQSAHDRISRSMSRAVERGKLTEAEADAALDRVSFTADLGELADRQLVVEAVPEDGALKGDVFAALDKTIDDDTAVLASNTSSIPIMRLASATARPERVVGLHFFNPVPVMPLVEVIGSLHTAPQTLERARAFVSGALGKQVVRSQDRAGFVVNALLVPYLLAAVRMLESGFAAAEDIDRGMTLGCAHPMGPLALCDLIGLDSVVAAARALYDEFKEPPYAPPPLLLRMVEGGLLGRKTGRGFYGHGSSRP